MKHNLFIYHFVCKMLPFHTRKSWGLKNTWNMNIYGLYKVTCDKIVHQLFYLLKVITKVFLAIWWLNYIKTIGLFILYFTHLRNLSKTLSCLWCATKVVCCSLYPIVVYVLLIRYIHYTQKHEYIHTIMHTCDFKNLLSYVRWVP